MANMLPRTYDKRDILHQTIFLTEHVSLAASTSTNLLKKNGGGGACVCDVCVRVCGITPEISKTTGARVNSYLFSIFYSLPN